MKITDLKNYTVVGDTNITPTTQSTKTTTPKKGFMQEGGAVQQFGTGIIKSGIGAVQGLGQLGLRGAELISGKKKGELGSQETFAEDKTFLEGKTGAEKVGKFAGDVAQFAIPGGAVTKATKALPFLARTGAKALTSAGVATAQSGEIGKETAIAGAVEAGIPIAGKLIKPATKFLGTLLKGTGSGLSGAPAETIEQIYKNPSIALQTAKEIKKAGGAKILKKNAETVIQGISKIKKEARTSYGEAIGALKSEDIKPDVFRKGVQSIFDKYGFSTSKKGREIANVEFKDLKNLKKANSIANMITNTNLDGLSLNKALQRIDDFKYPSPKTEEGLAFNAFVNDVSSNIKQVLNESTDKLGEINKAFSTDMQLAQATEDILGKVKYKNLGEINRTAKRLESLFTEKGLDPNTVDNFLERIGISSGNFKSTEAIRQLSEKSFTANTVGTSPFEVLRAFTSAVVSPKMVGKIAAYTGLGENIIKEMSEKLSPTTRGAIIKLLTGNPTEEPNSQ